MGEKHYPRGVVEVKEADEGVHSTSFFNGCPVVPLHAHPPQHLCSDNAAVPAHINNSL